MRRERGFTLVEMLVAMALMVTITGRIFSLVNPAQGAYRAQPEVSDMQQRLRVGTDVAVQRPDDGWRRLRPGRDESGSLANYFAPVKPFRQGTLSADPPGGSIVSDAITIMYVPPTISPNHPQRQHATADRPRLKVDAQTELPAGRHAVRLRDGMRP